MDKREKYRSLLAKLPIKVNEEEFCRLAADLFPHINGNVLSSRDLFEIMTRGAGVAIPSVFFRSGCLAIELWNGRLDLSLFEGNFFEDAEGYSEREWGGDLLSDKNTQGIKIYLLAPASMAVEKCFYVILDRSWRTIERDPSKSRSTIVNEAILDVSFDRLATLEFKRVRSFTDIPAFYHCDRCGCGLNDQLRCRGCGEHFAFDQQDFSFKRPNLGCPLPSKISSLLKGEMGDGYFVIDPAVFRAKESASAMKAET
jgi:hypothetical protein